MAETVHIFLLIVASLVGLSLSCKCVHPTDACTSDYALKGTIRGKAGNVSLHDDITYTVEIEEVIRNPGGMLPASGATVDLKTASHTCGYPDLLAGTPYFFSTNLDTTGSFFEFYKCDGIVRTYDTDGVLPGLYGEIDPDACSACRTFAHVIVVLVTAVCVLLMTHD